MITNPTHLEISGRQTGKTTRLLKAIHEHLKVGDVVLWGVMPFPYYMEKLTNPHTFVNAWDWVTAQPGPAERSSVGRVFPGAAKKLWKGEKPVNPRTFVDEWDWLTEPFPIERGGYYCTTLQHLRNEEDVDGDTPFAQLSRLADIRVNYSGDTPRDLYKEEGEEAWRCSNGEMFRTEQTTTSSDTPAGQQDYDDPHLAELGKYLCVQSVLTVCSAAGSNPAEIAGRILFRYMRQNNLVLVEATNPRERNGDGVCPECGRP